MRTKINRKDFKITTAITSQMLKSKIEQEQPA